MGTNRHTIFIYFQNSKVKSEIDPSIIRIIVRKVFSQALADLSRG